MKKIHTLLAIALVSSLSLSSALADQVGDKAKALSISEWLKGATAQAPVDVTDGKNIYVVEFWATWCPPCRTSIPHLTELQKRYKDKNVVFVGVSDETLQKAKPFVEEQADKMDYVVALDKENKTNADYMRAYGQNGIPCAFVINKEGQIAWVGHPMGLEDPLKEIIAGTYDLAAAIKADELRSKVDEYAKLANTKNDPKAAEKATELGLALLKEIGKNGEALDKMARAATQAGDTAMVEKVLDQMQALGGESAKKAESIRKGFKMDQAIENLKKAVNDSDAAALEASQKELLKCLENGDARDFVQVAYSTAMTLSEKSPKDFVYNMLDLADKAVKEKGKGGILSVSVYRTLVSYRMGDLEKGDASCEEALKEFTGDDAQSKQIKTILETTKKEAHQKKDEKSEGK